ncbi:hypothetical protein BU14_0266s0024 [Porphyra umbilicalis]|uniref:Probable ATP-dependent transporter ycf16 n=1 Tax=Porphyra umbilicalis TaxID=2786 RepID=A0A1X6P231_PORUM|nr:hypothetical protein BU14_0266s0024 [Porphyra umbilicalis]|eukprot:OSX74835.1 hypothetical protein BU14_0266s0024 [Porphyra umbilicalis]
MTRPRGSAAPPPAAAAFVAPAAAAAARGRLAPPRPSAAVAAGRPAVGAPPVGRVGGGGGWPPLPGWGGCRPPAARVPLRRRGGRVATGVRVARPVGRVVTAASAAAAPSNGNVRPAVANGVAAAGGGGSATPPAPPPPTNPFLRLARFSNRSERLLMVPALLAAVAASAVALCQPLMFGRILGTLLTATTTTVSPAAARRSFAAAIATVAAVYAAEVTATAVWVRLATRATERVVSRLRTAVYGSVVGRGAPFFDAHPPAAVLGVLTSDLDAVQRGFWDNLPRDRGVRAALEAVGALAVVTSMSPRLALVFLAIVPAAATRCARLGMAMGAAAAAEAAAGAAATASATAALRHIKTVVAFASAPVEAGRYGAAAAARSAAADAAGGLKAVLETTNRGAIYAILLAILGVGGAGVLAGSIPLTLLYSCIGYSWSLNFAVQGLNYGVADAGRAAAALGRVWALADASAADAAAAADREVVVPPPPPAGGRRGEVRLRGVHFRYTTRPDAHVLRGVDLTLTPGTTTALVGASGVGKSTTLELICRLYTPDAGSITLDGVDVGTIDRTWWASQVAVVTQEPVIWEGTILENLTYAAPPSLLNTPPPPPPPTTPGIVAAAKAASAHDFITALPRGYDTPLTPDATTLSGGQKQRLSLARALARRPSVLLLDEPSAALDAASEAAVSAALASSAATRSTLVIAHRLATVVAADTIAVMDGGRVVEAGSYGALMGVPGGAFRRLVETQSGAFVDADARAAADAGAAGGGGGG